MRPSKTPVTMIPSSLPTITGAISSVSLSGSVTSDISRSDVADITIELAEIYGVDINDVETTVDYITSGTLEITIPEGVVEAEVIDSLQQSISEVLDVHSSEVVVTIDDEGAITYSISGRTFTEVLALQEIAEQDNFADLVNANLLHKGSEISVETSVSNEDIEVVISATVDTTDATGTRDREVSITKLTQDYNLTDSNIQSNILKRSMFCIVFSSWW